MIDRHRSLTGIPGGYGMYRALVLRPGGDKGTGQEGGGDGLFFLI